MYKRIKGKKFSRKTDQRRAFIRSLTANLILRERMVTTKIRARQAASLAEKMITKAKKNDLAAKKALIAILPEVAVKKLVSQIAPRFQERNGGYTRITNLGPRAKDGAPMAVAEILDRPAVEKNAPEAKSKSAKPVKAKKQIKSAQNDKKEEKKS